MHHYYSVFECISNVLVEPSYLRSDGESSLEGISVVLVE